MSSQIGIARNAVSFFRKRLMSAYSPAEVFMPGIMKDKSKLVGLIKQKVEEANKTELVKKIKVAKGYAIAEMSPPKMNEMEKLKSDLALIKEFVKTGCYKELTVKQALLLFLVGLEVSLWFYLGETIGKFHLVGYKV